MRLVVPCPAKINTFLSVGPRDPRGYHPLRTIFQAIGLFDTLTITIIDKDENPPLREGREGGRQPQNVTQNALPTPLHPYILTSDWPDLPKENTLTKTLKLLQEVVTLPPISIHLEKRIPAQSGLGGGSSDAAGLIRAVNRITNKTIPEGELKAIATAVGADVPFFLVGGRAKGQGYGQRLTPLPDEPPRWLLIAMPEGVTCSTAEMFTKLDASPREWLPFPERDEIHNDFLQVAPQECRELIDRLQEIGGTEVGLSGSGSACFAFFADEEGAKTAQAQLECPSWIALTT